MSSSAIHLSNSQRRGFLAAVAVAVAVALAIALAVVGAPAVSATAKPTIAISGGLTQPVFS
jgi:uncharacterized membrane protein